MDTKINNSEQDNSKPFTKRVKRICLIISVIISTGCFLTIFLLIDSILMALICSFFIYLFTFCFIRFLLTGKSGIVAKESHPNNNWEKYGEDHAWDLSLNLSKNFRTDMHKSND